MGISAEPVVAADQMYHDPAGTAKETAVDMHDFSCVREPLRLCRSGYGEQFPVTTSSVRLLLRNQVGSKTGDLSTYARPFAGQDRDFSFFAISASGLFSYRTGVAGF